MKDALALALVHFLWQGAALAGAGAALMRVTKLPTVRYAIGAATLFAMLLAPVLTTAAISRSGAVSLIVAAAPGSDGAMKPSSSDRQGLGETQPETPAQDHAFAPFAIPTNWVLSLWALGVLVLSVRFIGGWAIARGLATDALSPVSEELQALAKEMAARLEVRSAVRVCESASMAVPVMLGCLRPVIILPAAVVASLPLAQLEAILAHELAHIRRHDYLVNLLQTGVETLCFYHPAVWWISREVRRHREQCCDDVAVEVCDRLTYVTALSSMASFAAPRLALSATGGSLRDRVRRLIEPSTASASPKGVWIAMLPILLVVALVAPQAAVPAEQSSAVQEVIRAETAKAVVAAREAAREQASTEQARARDRRAAAQIAEQVRVVRDANRAREVEQVRSEVEQSVAELQDRARLALAQNDIEQLESRLRDVERSLSRQRQLFDRGLATETSLRELEERLTQARLALERSHLEQSMIEGQPALTEALAELEMRGLSRSAGAPLDASAVLQPEDLLTIAIVSEPDLPTGFTVRPDGSIRFPFLGSIRVQGSTTAQVQSAIRKLLSDRGLVSNATVTVSARRRR